MEEKRGLYFYSKKLVSGTFAVSLVQGLKQVVGFFLLPILTIYLSPADYGIIAIIGLISSILNLVYNPGIVSATTRLYYDTDDEEEKKMLFGSAFIFFILFPALISIFLLLGGYRLFSSLFSEFDFYPYGYLAILLAFISQPQRLWTQLLTVQYKVPKIALVSAISIVLNIGISLLLVVGFKIGVVGRIAGMISAPLLVFAISVFTFKKYTSFSFSWKVIMKLLGFGSPLIIAIWSYTLLQMTSKYMLENMLGLNSVGLYDVALKISSVTLVLFLGLRQMWNPVFYENMKNRDFETIKRLISFIFVGFSLASAVIILFNKEVLLLLDEPFRKAGSIIPIIAVGNFFMGLLNVSNSYLGWKKNFKMISFIAAISLTVNIIMNFYLIPSMGLSGAAIATSVSFFLYFLLGILVSRSFFRKVIDIKIPLTLTIYLILLLVFEYLCDKVGFDLHLIFYKFALLIILVILIMGLKVISWKNILGFLNKSKEQNRPKTLE
jgi:O-antigen/teichoic acid export membrane protein